jgi:hypothetical protein
VPGFSSEYVGDAYDPTPPSQLPTPDVTDPRNQLD